MYFIFTLKSRMGKYAVISEEIKALGGIILRGNDSSSVDLDIYSSKKVLSKLNRYLLKRNFVVTSETKDYRHYKKILNDELYFIDMNLNLNYFLANFPGIFLKKTYEENYLKNPGNYEVPMKCLRYLFLFRKDGKYIKFFNENKSEILKNNFYLHYLNKNPFKEKIDYKDLERILSKNPRVLLRYLGIIGFIKFFFCRFKLKLKNYKRGRVFSIIGIDGVGKSTVISSLSRHYKIKSVYLGAGEYKTKNFADSVKSKHKNFLINFFFKILLYFENWSRISRAYIYTFYGKNVLLDRHPYYDGIGAWRKTRHTLFNKIFYNHFFPKGHKALILYCEPEIIISRKKERTKSEIETFYSNLSKLKSASVYKISNDDLDQTLYEISKIIFTDLR